VIINIQCTSCHTRYRIDDQVLPEATPTFKCSRCNHVFSLEPRQPEPAATDIIDEAPRRASRPQQHEQPAPPVPIGSIPQSSDEKPVADTPRVAAAEEEVSDLSADAAITASRSKPTMITSRKPAPSLPAKAVSTADLLNRSFPTKTAEAPSGENLAFDFRDEPAPSLPRQEPLGGTTGTAIEAARPAPKKIVRWEVGDDLATDNSPPAPRIGGFRIGTEPSSDIEEESLDTEDEPAADFVDEAEAPVYNRGVTHSSRFFLALFLLIAAGFAAVTLTIHGAPAAALDAAGRLPILGDHFAQPLAPARMVALRNVTASYQSSKDGRPALVIEGEGENVSTSSLHTIQITARIVTPRGVVQRDAYCGNNLTAEIGQMTAHEIEFFQRQPPLKDFTLESSEHSRFVIVFLDPPVSARNFELAVTGAQPLNPAEGASNGA